MGAPLIQLQDIHLTFGGTPLLRGAELVVGEGDRLCLVGRNGSGKSTLLKIAAGLVESDQGIRSAAPSATVRYLPQEPDLSGYATTLAFVEAGLAPGDDPYRAQYLLSCLDLTGNEATDALSGGEARRAALARVLAPEPDILLLDEPTNHLDLPAIEWLEGELNSLRSALVLISHDRRFLERLSRATVWLDRGITRRMEQGFGAFEQWRDTTLEQEELEQHKLDRRIAMEEHWVRYGVTARRKRNVGRMARLADLRQQRRDARRATGQVRLATSDAEQSGSLVVEAKNIAKAYGPLEVVRDFSTRIMRGDRLGIVGPNGAGKTTLIKLLTGVMQPDSGTVKLGANLQMHTLDQRREILGDDVSVKDFLTGGHETLTVNGSVRHYTSYMKDFLFTPEQARTPVRVLSGGERGRLVLAKALAAPSNLLVLDEPTNDLDLETLDLLQELLADYPGTVILVSHDRDFLDRVATSVLMAEGNGRFVEYAGGYTDMVNQRGSGVSAKPREAKPAKSYAPRTTTAAPAAERRKLSFKDKHALETLPARMEQLQKDIRAARERLSDETLYTRDPKTFAATAANLTTLEQELSTAEERWLELEILREEIEG